MSMAIVGKARCVQNMKAGEQLSLIGGGNAGDLIRSKDWSATVLGPIDSWPAELRAIVQTVLSSPVPMTVLWGPDGILIYNDGYADVCGPRHPEALGGKVLEIWPEAGGSGGRKSLTAAMVKAEIREPTNIASAERSGGWRSRVLLALIRGAAVTPRQGCKSAARDAPR